MLRIILTVALGVPTQALGAEIWGLRDSLARLEANHPELQSLRLEAEALREEHHALKLEGHPRVILGDNATYQFDSTFVSRLNIDSPDILSERIRFERNDAGLGLQTDYPYLGKWGARGGVANSLFHSDTVPRAESVRSFGEVTWENSVLGQRKKASGLDRAAAQWRLAEIRYAEAKNRVVLDFLTRYAQGIQTSWKVEHAEQAILTAASKLQTALVALGGRKAADIIARLSAEKSFRESQKQALLEELGDLNQILAGAVGLPAGATFSMDPEELMDFADRLSERLSAPGPGSLADEKLNAQAGLLRAEVEPVLAPLEPNLVVLARYRRQSEPFNRPGLPAERYNVGIQVELPLWTSGARAARVEGYRLGMAAIEESLRALEQDRQARGGRLKDRLASLQRSGSEGETYCRLLRNGFSALRADPLLSPENIRRAWLEVHQGCLDSLDLLMDLIQVEGELASMQGVPLL